jgi:hypothetical protein
MCIDIHTYMSLSDIHTSMCLCTCQARHVCMYVYIHRHMSIYIDETCMYVMSIYIDSTDTCTCAHLTDTCMYVYVTDTCTYVYVQRHIHVCISHRHMHVCICHRQACINLQQVRNETVRAVPTHHLRARTLSIIHGQVCDLVDGRAARRQNTLAP